MTADHSAALREFAAGVGRIRAEREDAKGPVLGIEVKVDSERIAEMKREIGYTDEDPFGDDKLGERQRGPSET